MQLFCLRICFMKLSVANMADLLILVKTIQHLKQYCGISTPMIKFKIILYSLFRLYTVLQGRSRINKYTTKSEIKGKMKIT